MRSVRLLSALAECREEEWRRAARARNRTARRSHLVTELTVQTAWLPRGPSAAVRAARRKEAPAAIAQARAYHSRSRLFRNRGTLALVRKRDIHTGVQDPRIASRVVIGSIKGHPAYARLKQLPPKESARWVLGEIPIEHAEPDLRRKAFRQVAKNITAGKAERSKYGFNSDTNGEIARAMEWAFQAGQKAAQKS